MNAIAVPRKIRAPWWERLCLILAAGFVLTVVFEGVLRWALDRVHVPQLIYARDITPIAIMLGGTVVAYRRRNTPWLLGMSALVALAFGAFIWSCYCGTAPVQALFGLKTLWLLPAGAALWNFVQEDDERRTRFAWICLACVGVGLLYSAVASPPWLGATYEIGDVTVEGQREWTIDSINRIGGFSRSSVDAASQLAFFTLIILGSRGRAAMKWIVVLLALVGFVGTTSRSVTLGFLLAVSAYGTMRVFGRSALRWVLLPIPLLPVLVYLAVVFFPSAVNSVAAADRGGLRSTSSFLMRSDAVWLDAASQIDGAEEWLLGAGVGNIGSAQKAFAPEIHNSADNVFVYCLVSFGIVGCCVIFGLLLRTWVGVLTARQVARYGWMIALLSGAGVTMSVLESPLLSLGAGLAIGECFSGLRIPGKFRRKAARRAAPAGRQAVVLKREASEVPEHAIDEHR